MSGCLNSVQLIGHLGKDPEVRRLNNGDQVVSFRMATSESWRDKQTGERKEKVEWHSIVIFNENIGKIVEQYCKKGTKVYIQGALQTRKWSDQSGAEKYTTEVVLQKFNGQVLLLSGKNDGDGESRGRDRDRDDDDRRETKGSAPVKPSSGVGSDLDQDIPFAANFD